MTVLALVSEGFKGLGYVFIVLSYYKFNKDRAARENFEHLYRIYQQTIDKSDVLVSQNVQTTVVEVSRTGKINVLLYGAPKARGGYGTAPKILEVT